MAEPPPSPAIESTAIAEPLDTFLREVVQTLHTAVAQGMRAEAPEVAEKSVQDCKEILDVIMAGDVQEWLA